LGEESNIQKKDENTIHVFIPKKHVPEDEVNVSEDEESLDITLYRDRGETNNKNKRWSGIQSMDRKRGHRF